MNLKLNYVLIGLTQVRSSFILELLVFGLKLNVLKQFASNVLITFLNIIDSIGCALVIFHSHKPTGSVNALYDCPYHGRQERNIKINKNNLSKTMPKYKTLLSVLQ